MYIDIYLQTLLQKNGRPQRLVHIFICHLTLPCQLAGQADQLNSFQETGLPHFSWYKIPKREKNIPNYHKLYQMSIKFIKRP
jgi:hypothetical protein